MNQRLPNGAALRGGPMPQPVAGAAPPSGPNGAMLASVAQPQPPPQAPMPPQQMAGGQQDQGELDQAIAAVIEAAKSVGFELPPDGVAQEQLPQVYAVILAAAAQSEMGQSPDGQQLIDQLAQALGVSSPFGGGAPGTDPQAGAAPAAMLPGGAMPGGSMA